MAADEQPICDDEWTALFQLFAGRRIALAVSGGVDSMVLMYLVAKWQGTLAGAAWLDSLSALSARPEHDATPGGSRAACGAAAEPFWPLPIGLPLSKPTFAAEATWLAPPPPEARVSDPSDASHLPPPPPIVVLTVDHGLRASSREEADLVAATARALGLPHQTLLWSDGAVLRQSGGQGLQRRAREARYGLIADVVESESWQRWQASRTPPSSVDRPSGTTPAPCPLAPGRHRRLVVTAHHRDDLVETFLMRLKRGSGLAGLSAIRTFETLRRPPVASRPYPAPLDLCRPLLDLPKQRLIATARVAGLVWREDPSNTNTQFERIAQRRAMPALAELGLSAPALHLTIRRLQRAHAAIEATVRGLQVGEPGRPPAVDHHGGLFARFDAHLVGTLEPEIHQRLLAVTIAAYGGGEEAPELTQLEALADHLHACWRRDAAGTLAAGAATARTLAGCRIDYCRHPGPGREGQVRVWREAGRDGLPTLTLSPGDGAWWDHRFALSVSTAAPKAVTVRALGPDGWAEVKRQHPALAGWRDPPPGAAATLPAIWHGVTLIALPSLDRLVSLARRAPPAGHWPVTAARAVPDASKNLYNATYSPAAGP